MSKPPIEALGPHRRDLFDQAAARAGLTPQEYAGTMNGRAVLSGFLVGQAVEAAGVQAMDDVQGIRRALERIRR